MYNLGHVKIEKVPFISGDIKKKTKTSDSFFIFFWSYLKRYEKTKATLSLSLFKLNEIALTDFSYDVSFSKNHYQFSFSYTVLYFLFLLLKYFYLPNSMVYYTCPKKVIVCTSWGFYGEVIRLSLSFTCDSYGKYLKSSS